MGANGNGNKLTAQVTLLVAGCVVLGALLLNDKGSPALRVPLTMTPTAADVAPAAEPAPEAPRAVDRRQRLTGSRQRMTAPASSGPSEGRTARQPDRPPTPDSAAAPAGTQKPKKPKPPPTLEREALSYVGVDPLAEAIWADAINDPSISAEDRSDFIEDLNEDGFANPRRITPDDLPLIVSRLALIEQLAPDAMDDVNAAAFAEAYKDLTNMYARVTGLR